MCHPPPQPCRPGIAFGTLVEDIAKHPWFPLIIKKIFEVCGSTAFQHSQGLSHLLQVERDAKALQIFAKTHGLLAAEKQWSRTDVFMSTIVAALNQMSVGGTQGYGELTNTIATGRFALGNISTDPQFLNTTNKHRTRQAHETHPIPQPEGIRHPDTTGEGVDNMLHCDTMQRLKGIQKPGHASRKALSDKAKAILERWFQDHLDNPYPTGKQKQRLTIQCAVSLSTVNNWFGNKRMRIKRKMLRMGSQVSDDTAGKGLAPRSKWNAVVMSKMRSPVGREVAEHATGVTALPGESGAFGKKGHSTQAKERVGPSAPGRSEKEQRVNSSPSHGISASYG